MTSKMSNEFSSEVRERAARMAAERKGGHPLERAAMSAKIGCTVETLSRWVRQPERDQGLRPCPRSGSGSRHWSERSGSCGGPVSERRVCTVTGSP